MRALVVGGTGPTGPHIVEGLQERGYEVAVLHRGTHELDGDGGLDGVEHLHADPHFRETFAEGVANRAFDLVITTYGRIRLQADVLAGRCARFMGVGGVTVYLGNAEPARAHPYGMKVLAREGDPVAAELPGQQTQSGRFVQQMVDTERTAFGLHEQGAFDATWFRYPIIYGPRNIIPWEWSVLRRVRDGRRELIVADGGHNVRSRACGRNAAHAVLLAVDQPDAARGQVFNLAEDEQYTLRQWLELVNDAAAGQLTIVSLPWAVAHPGRIFLPFRGTGSPHVLADTTKLRALLGYRDVIATRDALAESVGWYAEHPVTSERYPNFPDRFDYEREDRLLAVYRRCLETIEQEAPWPEERVIHNYAHPREAGQLRDHRGR